MFHYSVKYFDHGLKLHLATQTVTMLTSCYGAFSISVNGEPTRVPHVYVNENMVRYMRPHGRFAHGSCKNTALTFDLD